MKYQRIGIVLSVCLVLTACSSDSSSHSNQDAAIDSQLHFLDSGQSDSGLDYPHSDLAHDDAPSPDIVADQFAFDATVNLPPTAISVQSLRSTTVHIHGVGIIQNHLDIISKLDAVKAIGFNAVWLVNAWRDYHPKPIAEPNSFSDTSFQSLLNLLAEIKARDLKAIIPLNYMGDGWYPEGIDCNIINTPTQWQAFVHFSTEFLKRIAAYNDIVYITTHAESMQPCNADYIGADAQKVALAMQATIGDLPAQLPLAIRNAFVFGFHDWGFVPLDWSKGVYPMPASPSYDFVSATLYHQESISDQGIQSSFSDRLARLRAAYPSLPVLWGEYGSSICNYTPAEQARVIRTSTEAFLQENIGFNVWGFHLLGSLHCTSHEDLRLENDDLSLRPSAEAIRALVLPEIMSVTTTGTTISFDPWVVWAKGVNITNAQTATLFDQDGKVWGENLAVTVNRASGLISFGLPSNSPPSQCNKNAPCDLSYILADSTGRQSRRVTLSIPRYGI